MTQFIPDKPKKDRVVVPFFEDSQDEQIPGRGTHKPVELLQQEVKSSLIQLGAVGVMFGKGTYPGPPERRGFQITFEIYAQPARLTCLALPLKLHTAKKEDRALAQALYLLRDELIAIHYSSMHKPSDDLPLIHAVIGEGGKTIGEYLVESGQIPLLGRG